MLSLLCQVSAGARHSFFLGPRDELWGSGANDEGQLALQSVSSVALPTRIPGLPGLPLRFAVAAGDHTIAVVEESSPQNGGLQRHSSGDSCTLFLGLSGIMLSCALFGLVLLSSSLVPVLAGMNVPHPAWKSGLCQTVKKCVCVSSSLMTTGPCRRSCMMTLQMPPDLSHYAEVATGPNASRREVLTFTHLCCSI